MPNAKKRKVSRGASFIVVWLGSSGGKILEGSGSCGGLVRRFYSDSCRYTSLKKTVYPLLLGALQEAAAVCGISTKREDLINPFFVIELSATAITSPNPP